MMVPLGAALLTTREYLDKSCTAMLFLVVIAVIVVVLDVVVCVGSRQCHRVRRKIR